MKLKSSLFTLAILLAFPLSVFALNAPTVIDAPEVIDADFYELKIKVAVGAKVSVIGGISSIAPMTDGVGNDELDGEVKIAVGLAQNAINVFSITAEKEGDFSESITVSIEEKTDTTVSKKGDVTAPAEPIVDEIVNPVLDTKYKITGSVEANANIYVKATDGSTVGSTKADGNGLFHVTVQLEPNKTNRFNISAEDAAYNLSSPTQVVIQALAPEVPVTEEEAETKTETETKLPFVDLEEHWAKGFVSTLYAMGIVSGKSDVTFEPDAKITRAELTKIALLAFDHELPNELDEPVFKDVSKEDWFAPFVQAAEDEGIVSGFDDGFRPGKPITRVAALKILLEASGLEIDASATIDFKDTDKEAWYVKYVAFAKQNNIVGGYSDSTFRPGNEITRAEVAKLVVKILELKGK